MVIRFLYIGIFILAVSAVCCAQTSDAGGFKLNGRLFYGNRVKSDLPILLLSNGIVTSETSSDSLGNFSFSDLKSGNYKILILEPDYNVDTSFAISNQSIDHFQVFLDAPCEVNHAAALKDIAAGKPRLLLVGSIAPVHVVGQEKFEKKFNVVYYNFGYSPPDAECIREYNEAIFGYLDERYGKKWRKEVRMDVKYLTK